MFVLFPCLTNKGVIDFMCFLGMAHRDLKPENILCERADKVSLL